MYVYPNTSNEIEIKVHHQNILKNVSNLAVNGLIDRMMWEVLHVTETFAAVSL